MVAVTAPFPYHGGKGRWAADIWDRFGAADVYAEPFAGSLAVLLAAPTPARREVVCDSDGHICNFWRAVQHDPEAVARHADWPTIHQDLTARHTWLRRWGAEHAERLSSDPEFFDSRAAGWWVWGISLWIGGEWCSTEHDKIPKIAGNHIPGGGVSAQRSKVPHDKRPKAVGNRLGTAYGVSAQRDQIPHVDPWIGGKGVSVQRDRVPQVTGRIGCHPGERQLDLIAWFTALQDRLKRVIVLNRDWRSAVTPSLLVDTPTGPGDSATRCVLLDPPYRTDRRKANLYGSDADGTSDDAAVASYAWALKHGDRYRIAYCCHADDFPVPEGWEAMTRGFKGRRTGASGTTDMVMFSPACVTPQPRLWDTGLAAWESEHNPAGGL